MIDSRVVSFPSPLPYPQILYFILGERQAEWYSVVDSSEACSCWVWVTPKPEVWISSKPPPGIAGTQLLKPPPAASQSVLCQEAQIERGATHSGGVGVSSDFSTTTAMSTPYQLSTPVQQKLLVKGWCYKTIFFFLQTSAQFSSKLFST